MRLNFTSLIEIVDILGGVDVYSDYAFNTGWESGYEMAVSEGYNHFNGQQALAFCRERHNLVDGDNQRGRNQQAVIHSYAEESIIPDDVIESRKHT